MTTERWAPFSAFTSLEQEMHALLDRIGARPWLEGFGWKPDTDIYREDVTLVVQTELPGIEPKTDLTVEVEDSVLQITGRKPESTEISDSNRYIKERRLGSFCRSVMLPKGVDPSAVTACYRNGLLTVRVPLPEASSEDSGSRRTPVEVTLDG